MYFILLIFLKSKVKPLYIILPPSSPAKFAAEESLDKSTSNLLSFLFGAGSGKLFK